MKSKLFVVFLFLLLLFSFSSCNENYESYDYEGDEFTLEKSIAVLEKNGWKIVESSYSLEEQTMFIINSAKYDEEDFTIEILLDSKYLTAPKKIQKKQRAGYEVYVNFDVFSSTEDALKYYSLQERIAGNYPRGIKMAINNNIVVSTNSEEVIDTLPIDFIIVWW